MENDAADPSGDPSKCRVCGRDPHSPPPVPPTPHPPRTWRGTKSAWAKRFRQNWPEIWRKRVSPTALGLCQRDYQASRRPKSIRSNARPGATERLTIWVDPDLKERTQAVAAEEHKSVSTWGAEAIDTAVKTAESTK